MEPEAPKPRPRPRYGSVTPEGSSRLMIIIEDKTKIIRGLFNLEVKRRGTPLRWILLVALVLVVGALALDSSLREFVISRLRRN